MQMQNFSSHIEKYFTHLLTALTCEIFFSPQWEILYQDVYRPVCIGQNHYCDHKVASKQDMQIYRSVTVEI